MTYKKINKISNKVVTKENKRKMLEASVLQMRRMQIEIDVVSIDEFKSSWYIRCYSIWPSISISICSVSIILFFRSNSKSRFWPEELISSGLKLSLPASKRHMLYSSMQFPFGSKKVNFRPESSHEQH